MSVPGEPPGARAARPVTLAELLRWEEHGATWRAIEIGERDAVLQLCTCHGEAVDVVRAGSAEVIELIRRRAADGD
jgi:hypothetical protein